ncbi:hypothetical protein NQ315_013745 [Exocentrus adspersus]|uniref:C2H2-type domain-containing protein n=1 Tax=Exocentrus adspersus TaxID=1586481 RepID=A0AAV8W4A5_9CUCU|nr:hypothetical protein NQ315_013745 [Exocentrus adspersus]
MTIMPVYCNICEKIFTTRCHLNRHLRNVHHVTPKPTSYDKSVHSFKCLEESCNNSFRYNSDLIKHLKNDHSFNIEDPEIKIFVNEEDFKNWKLKIETTEKCNYVIIRGIQRLSCGDVKTYYVCNRSGFYHKKYKQKATKYHGTCKINSSCISQMNVTMLANGTIKVERQKMHYGHSISIQHLRISKEDRNIIANKLIQGESKKSILESFRNKIGTDIKRSDLITLKDIENVQRDFKLSIEKGIKHEEDAINIDLWVTENMQCKENPVIYYKPQGENMDPLEIDDFCLIIMNQYQQLMLKTFGQNTIVVDSTHGLTQYDFEMTTIMVIDDCGEGFPVTYMFTNRKDTVVHTLLFDVIRTRIGILKTKTFMSHMSEVFYEAWTYSMGKTEHQLYCSWHVDRAWQMNLSKIANKKKRALVNKTLKAVQQNVDSNSFEDQFDSMLEDLLIDPDTKAFGLYLETNYSKNYEKWAYCYRKKLRDKCRYGP